jgi:hypothetical protein
MGSFGVLEILVLLLLGPILYIWSLVWAYRDAESRSSNGLLARLLVALAAWPLSIVVWILIRPKRAF